MWSVATTTFNGILSGTLCSRKHIIRPHQQGYKTINTMKYDFHYIRKAKNMETINKILKKFFSRTDLKDVTYEIIEISSGSLKYQLDFNANWK